jgi:hypothetical protein
MISLTIFLVLELMLEKVNKRKRNRAISKVTTKLIEFSELINLRKVNGSHLGGLSCQSLIRLEFD